MRLVVEVAHAGRLAARGGGVGWKKSETFFTRDSVDSFASRRAPVTFGVLIRRPVSSVRLIPGSPRWESGRGRSRREARFG